MNGPETRRFWISPIGVALRWVIALPAGLVAALLLMFPVHWAILLVYYFSGSNADSMITTVSPAGEEKGCGLMGLTCFVSMESMERLAQAFVVPFVTLTVVGKVVPSHKFYAVAALFVIYLLVFGGFITLALTNGAYSGWGWLELAAVLALGVSGSVGAVYGQFQDWKESRSAA
ncbi:MAG: hypothetical protein V1724_04275 [Chloroflexota bacterium]